MTTEDIWRQMGEIETIEKLKTLGANCRHLGGNQDNSPKLERIAHNSIQLAHMNTIRGLGTIEDDKRQRRRRMPLSENREQLRTIEDNGRQLKTIGDN